MKVVLDTDVIVAAIRSPTGASAALLQYIAEGGATMILSVAMALEYEAVCVRAEHQLASGLNEKEIHVFLDGLFALAHPVIAHFRWRPQLHDAADEMVLEAAVNSGADAIVSFNHRHFGEVPKQFGINLYKPSELLRRVKL